MNQMTLFVGAGLAVVIAFYAGVRIGLWVGRRDGTLEGAAKMMGVFEITTQRH